MGPTDKITPEDLAAMAAGALGFLNTLAAVFPDISTEELLERGREVSEGKAAAQLLHQVLTLRKLKVG